MSSRHPHDAPDRPARDTGVASWYVPGRRDGFGDRLLMFDNVGTPSLELLRFRTDLSVNAAFEHHLRERVDQLRQFSHPAFAAAHRVQRLGQEEGLALVSTHAEGQPLSAVIGRRAGEPAEPDAVAAFVGDLLQALQALHAEGAAHGAITPDRLVVPPEGGLRITEHVLGAALQQLPLLPAQLWREFGVVSAAGGGGFAEVSPRSDLVQAAAVALSMLLARPVTQPEVEQRLPALVAEVSRPASRASRAWSRLERWLENAFRANGSGYASAAEARRDLRELANGRIHVGVGPAAGAVDVREDPPREARHRRYPSVSELASLTDYPTEAAAPVQAEPAQPVVPASVTFEFVAAEPAPRSEPSRPSPRGARAVSMRVAVSLAAVIVIEAAVIALLAVQLLMR